MAARSISRPQTPSFKLTDRQLEANQLLAGPAQHVLLYGGSRSGKTFLFCRALAIRSIKAAGSRHAILRYRFGHIKASIIYDTWPRMMQLCFPELKCEMNKSDWFCQFPNGSEVWFGGLDDKERTEKILGNEYSTVYLNECSQIPWNSRNMAITRLAQRVDQEVGEKKKPLTLKAYYDENPPDKGHWTYKLFRGKQDPETKRPLEDPDNYASMQLNPGDNLDNLAPGYLSTLKSLPSRLQTRFLKGEFRESAPGALFIDEHLERYRVTDQPPEMQRIVIAIDPSGADDIENQENDEIGIVVCGLGLDGNGYVLEDLTCKTGPATWGRIATQAYERWQANSIVAEINFGGAMVKHVIHTARPRTPFREVRASRGKVVRAEPVSSLCETGQIRLAGSFPLLEDELYGFTTHGFVGANSPNRADAMIWGMSDLFPQLLGAKEPEKPVTVEQFPTRQRNDGQDWMAM